MTYFPILHKIFPKVIGNLYLGRTTSLLTVCYTICKSWPKCSSFLPNLLKMLFNVLRFCIKQFVRISYCKVNYHKGIVRHDLYAIQQNCRDLKLGIMHKLIFSFQATALFISPSWLYIVTCQMPQGVNKNTSEIRYTSNWC